MRSVALSLFALGAALPAFAQDASPIALQPLTLQSGFFPTEQARYGRAVSVIDAAEIASRGLTRVQDVLRALPGVSVTGSGRDYTQIRIRGGESNHILVLIDGQEAVGGGEEYVFSGLETTDIARVEVLRGPQSVYYGANAASGVINIVTKTADASGGGFGIEGGAGHNISAWSAIAGPKAGLRLSASDSRDDGVDVSGTDGERDYLKRQSQRLIGWWQATDQLRFTASLMRATEKSRQDQPNDMADSADTVLLDDAAPGVERFESWASLGAQYESASGRVLHDLSYALTRQDRLNDGEAIWGKGKTRALKYRAQIGLDGAAADARQRLNLMAERQEDSHSAAMGEDRKTRSLAAEYQGDFANGFSLQAGLRHDNNSGYADFTSWQLSTSYVISDQWRLHAAAGRASVQPSFYELYADDRYSLGNRDLVAEENRSLDIGVKFTTADGSFTGDVTLFREVLRSEINYVPMDVGSRYTYRNTQGKSLRKGVEASGKWQINPQLSLGASYTYLRSADGTGIDAPRRPRQEAGLQVNWQRADEKLRLGADLRHVRGNQDTQYFTYPAARVALPSYSVVNLTAAYSVTDSVDLTARVVNALDKSYSDTWGYHAQDRQVWLGLSARF